jgi:hypothetical protein
MFIKTRFSASFFWVSLALFASLALPPLPASAGPYANSAHGNNPGPDLLSNNGYGVLRTIFIGTYVRGNCAHCHEQHASIGGVEPAPAGGSPSGYLLLSTGFSGKQTNTVPYGKDDNVCFYCHATTGSVQQSGGITNNNYGATFGGATAESTSIMAAFNQASYHNLYDLKRYITGVSGSKSFSNFPAGSNPCSGCHNVHIAKANKRTPGDPTYTAISKPSAHNSLWGDDTSPNERMTAYGTAYQPLYYTGSTNLEPDGVSNVKATQAAKTPDYNVFCIDCHNSSNLIYSTTLLRNLKTFNWGLEVHGAEAAVNWTAKLEMNLPYVDASLGTYLLSCLDCHEPHGSSNEFLIRNSVNKMAVVLPIASPDWDRLCSSCHLAAADLKTFHHQIRDVYACTACHLSGGGMVNCINCHYHGSSSGGYKTF